MLDDRDAHPTFRRYVAIGDSSTEGLEDPDGHGGYIGWADRLAALIARGQDEPLEYANLAVRGLRMAEIKARQLDLAVSYRPDLVSIFGGMNDIIGPRPHFGRLAADLTATFGAAADTGATVITFTLPDLVAINPLASRLSQRMTIFNDLVRATAHAHNAVLMDFQRYPIAEDPRLWFADRLHGNPVGHARVAAALAWELGLAGADESWAQAIEPEYVRPVGRERFASDADWLLHYFGPWLGRGLRRIPSGHGIEPKRPVPTVVDPSSVSCGTSVVAHGDSGRGLHSSP